MLPGPLGAQQELFFEGNRAYQEGEFEEALDAYLRVYEAGFTSGTLLYNIGNASFKTGDLPRAILFYERATKLLPGDEDVRANLELSRSLIVDEITPLPRFWLLEIVDWWIGVLPRSLLILIVGTSYAIAGAAVVGLVLGRAGGLRRWSFRVAVTAGVVCVLFGINLAIRELGVTRVDEAIIMSTEVDARSGPSEDPNLTLFSVHAGTKVRIDRASDGWAEIVLEDGRVGWIPVEAMEVI